MSNLLVVMLGCALGGAMRYLITTYINKLGYFPYGTLAVNLIGCFLIGMIATLLHDSYIINRKNTRYITVSFFIFNSRIFRWTYYFFIIYK